MTANARRWRGSRQRQRQRQGARCTVAGCEVTADCLYIEDTSRSVDLCREHYIARRLAAETAADDDGEGLLR